MTQHYDRYINQAGGARDPKYWLPLRHRLAMNRGHRMTFKAWLARTDRNTAMQAPRWVRGWV